MFPNFIVKKMTSSKHIITLALLYDTKKEKCHYLGHFKTYYSGYKDNTHIKCYINDKLTKILQNY